MTCVVQDPRSGHEDTWYAGTGEPGSSASYVQGSGNTGSSYAGHGIYKSTDNGLTWSALISTQTGLLENFDSEFDFITRIVVNPANGDVLAVNGGAILRSTNGGLTWANEVGTLTSATYGDIIYNSGGNKFYAAIHGQDGSGNGGIWESSDGDNWTKIRTTAQLSGAGVGRIVLANAATTAGIYAFIQTGAFSCTNSNQSAAGLWHFDGTSTWTNYSDKVGNCTSQYTPSTALPTQLELQGGYNMALATKPDDANIVFIGGTEGYRFNRTNNAYEFIGGTQKGFNAVNLHVDHHIYVFEPGSNTNMWCGSDGGVRSTNVTGTITATTNNHDNGYVWANKNNGFNGYQFYGVDIDPANGTDYIAGGHQDNAFTLHPNSSAAVAEVGPTVDGVDVGIISATDLNTHNLFLMWQNGSMIRFENGNQVTNSLNPSATGFVGHFYLDADNRQYMYYPGSNPSNELYRTRGAGSLTSGATGPVTSAWENMTGVNGAITNPITAMDATRDVDPDHGGSYSSSNANRKLYFGTSGGKVFRLDDPAFTAAGTAPVDITPTGMSSNGYVSDIAVNPYDDNEILVTYSNYTVASVWHTTNANTGSPTWTNVEGPGGNAVALASARSAMITKANNVNIYLVGTSTGLYATDALSGATTSWTKIGSAEIGQAVVVEMRLRTSDNKIAVGTHGNGGFVLNFPQALPVELASFQGQAVDKGNLLTWRTISEIQNRGFDVERSTNGIDFQK
ncbi:MAG: hypothetical protein HC803_00630 [Saprospiraceae bacterium]|nr:hypothetical protein [Saprospiraceae bacterium]